jgi:aspartyl aminopeptidase
MSLSQCCLYTLSFLCSPNLKVKPRSKTSSKNGVIQLGVQCYGGGLWHTWFDRDLGISGKVIVQDLPTTTLDTDIPSTYSQQLIQIMKPVARVSTLCIHLQTAEERKAFMVNTESHMVPVVATDTTSIRLPRLPNNATLENEVASQLNNMSSTTIATTATNDWQSGQEPLLLSQVALDLDIQVSQIMDYDLNLFDTQPAVIGGFQNEFIYSARLDNLATVFCAVEALTNYATSENKGSDTDICLIACFDHEEVNSESTVGAGSPM